MDLIFNLLIFASMILGGMFVIFLPFVLYKEHKIRQDILKFSEGQYFSLYAFHKLTQTYLGLKEEDFKKYLIKLDPVVNLFLKAEDFDINNFSNVENNVFKKSKLDHKIIDLVKKYCNENYDYPLFYFEIHTISYITYDIDYSKNKLLTEDQKLNLKTKFQDNEFKKRYASANSFIDFLNKKLESANTESIKSTILETVEDIEKKRKSYFNN